MVQAKQHDEPPFEGLNSPCNRTLNSFIFPKKQLPSLPSNNLKPTRLNIPQDSATTSAEMPSAPQDYTKNLIGHKIDDDRFEFVATLGVGAYGVVYVARDVKASPLAHPPSRKFAQFGNQPLYAVKCLNKHGLDSRQRSFQSREIRLHAQARKHPNVVSLFKVLEETNCIYVILEYCDDGDLFGMITEQQRYLGNDNLIRSIFLQIVDAVEHCHSLGIYHRDLKPENILCLEGGTKVMLADFGLATNDPMSRDFGCGSTFYMSPECQGGLFQRINSYSSKKNDIWSLGVILVNLVCGRNPWKQACPSDETFRAYLGNPNFLRSILPISEYTNEILKGLFALNPSRRLSLRALRTEIMNVKSFSMTPEELAVATRATQEAARPFVNDSPPPKFTPNATFKTDNPPQILPVDQKSVVPITPPRTPPLSGLFRFSETFNSLETVHNYKHSASNSQDLLPALIPSKGERQRYQTHTRGRRSSLDSSASSGSSTSSLPPTPTGTPRFLSLNQKSSFDYRFGPYPHILDQAAVSVAEEDEIEMVESRETSFCYPQEESKFPRFHGNAEWVQNAWSQQRYYETG